MRLILPDATFVDLLYNTVLRRRNYYNNSDNLLTNERLRDDIVSVLSYSISDLDFISSSKHGRFKVDKVYCQEHNTTPRKYSRAVAKILHQQDISKWYNKDLSVTENLKWADTNGIKVSRSTLRRYCNDNNINQDPHKVHPREWYDRTLSLTENLNRAKESGIKISQATLYRYCQENGINTKGE